VNVAVLRFRRTRLLSSAVRRAERFGCEILGARRGAGCHAVHVGMTASATADVLAAADRDELEVVMISEEPFEAFRLESTGVALVIDESLAISNNRLCHERRDATQDAD
jgi:hypothetical protein